MPPVNRTYRCKISSAYCKNIRLLLTVWIRKIFPILKVHQIPDTKIHHQTSMYCCWNVTCQHGSPFCQIIFRNVFGNEMPERERQKVYCTKTNCSHHEYSKQFHIYQIIHCICINCILSRYNMAFLLRLLRLPTKSLNVLSREMKNSEGKKKKKKL